MYGENEIIQLQDEYLIAVSKTRKCYLHPSDPCKIIKIIRKSAPLRERKANWKEWTHYQHLKKNHPQLDFISTYHGFVETNLGRGLLIDCIRDHNGRVSKRLEKVLVEQAEYDLKAVENALEQLCRKIIENNIQLYDLNRYNILIQILPDGEYHPVIVDVKGRYNNYELIPVSNYIPFFSRMKLKRRCLRLIRTIQQAWQKNNPER